jgi:hypothetical protein
VSTNKLTQEVLPPDGVNEALEALIAALEKVQKADWTNVESVTRMNALCMTAMICETLERRPKHEQKG